MKPEIWISIILFLLSIVNVVECSRSIRCYVCNTMSGPNADRCGDDFRLTSTSTSFCDGSCQKTRGYRASGSRDVPEITRGCVPFTEKETCYKGDHNGIKADICICNEELCNSASVLTISKWAGLGMGMCSVIISKILFIHWHL